MSIFVARENHYEAIVNTRLRTQRLSITEIYSYASVRDVIVDKDGAESGDPQGREAPLARRRLRTFGTERLCINFNSESKIRVWRAVAGYRLLLEREITQTLIAYIQHLFWSAYIKGYYI